MTLVVPAELMGNHVGEQVTVKGKLDTSLLGSGMRSESGKIYWFSYFDSLGILVRDEHADIVPDEFKNQLFRGEGTVCVSGRVSKSYELFSEGEVLVNPIRHHDIKVGC